MSYTSCLISKLSKYTQLGPDQHALLNRLEKDSVSLIKNESLEQPAGINQNLYVVRDGWLMSTRKLENGSEAIARLYMPGDIVGFDTLCSQEPGYIIKACSNAVVCPFFKKTLNEIFVNDTKLSSIFFYMLARDHMFTMEVLSSVISLQATSRLASYLIILRARMEAFKDLNSNKIDIEITQKEIGQAINLSHQQVNRSFKELLTLGLVEYKKNEILFLNFDGLQDYCQFKRELLVLSLDDLF